MTAAPDFPAVLRAALQGVDSEDVRLFYDYFEGLKGHVRRHLGRKARGNPGSSAVAQSALLSMLCDLSLQQVPLADVDDYGQPALWPLLLAYVERHCDKWNKYYLAKKRRGAEVPVGAADAAAGRMGVDPPDPRSADNEESHVVARCEELQRQLTDEERAVFDLWVAGKTLDQTAEELQARGKRCGVAKVSYLRQRVREKLLTG